MSRVRVCLFALFLVLNIAIQFGNCEDTSNPLCENVSPGSDETRLSYIEWFLKKMKFVKSPLDEIDRFQNDKVPARSFSSSLNKIKLKLRLIFPGTLWCGDGDIAKNKNDLGKFNETDACCRAHDNCKSDISAGETQANLKNNGIFTRSACACDDAFYECLKKANSVLSRGIGRTYFNMLGQQCFKCICPTDDCNASIDSSECKDRCDKYKWVDSSDF